MKGTVRSGLLLESLVPLPPPLPLHPSVFMSEGFRKTGKLYIAVTMIYTILRLQFIMWKMLKRNAALEIRRCLSKDIQEEN